MDRQLLDTNKIASEKSEMNSVCRKVLTVVALREDIEEGWNNSSLGA